MATASDTLGNKLRTLRVQRGWSQEEVARRVGVRALAVGKWERDQQNPSDEHLVNVAKVYGVDPRDLGYEPPAWTPEKPPQWFADHSDTIHTYLQALEQRAVTAEQKLDRIMQMLERSTR